MIMIFKKSTSMFIKKWSISVNVNLVPVDFYPISLQQPTVKKSFQFELNKSKRFLQKWRWIMHKNQELRTFMESKHAVTRPFWTSTWGGGWANLHSVSVRVHLLRWYSRQTSRVSQRESLTLLPIANRLFTMAITRCHTEMKDDGFSYDQTQKIQ